MPYDPLRHRRRSIRLKGYDYAQAGAYFVTVCTHQRECLFGEVVRGEMVLNPHGEIVWDCWQETPDHFPNVELDAFVVMPNHVHAVIVVVGDGPPVGATHASPLRKSHAIMHPRGPEPRSLGAMVGSFKSAVTKRVNRLRDSSGARVWQRGYYGKSLRLFLGRSRSSLRDLHATRNDDELNCIRAYIAADPARWDADRLNPFRLTPAADQRPYPWEGN